MDRSQENLEYISAARHYLYSVFQRLFGSEPDIEMFSGIDVALMREAFVIVGMEDGDLAEAVEQAPQHMAELRAEYTSVLIGPHKLPAPPWESVYVTKEAVLFTRTTLEVRNFYRSQGLIPELYPKVADDHIALELDFLRLLAERALKAFQAGEQKDYEEALAASREFLDEHLLKWVDQFADALQDSKKGVFYPRVAQVLATFAAKDKELIERLR